MAELPHDLRLRNTPFASNQPLHSYRRFDGINRADSGAASAAGTPVFSPPDDIGELLECDLVILI
jgi:hypothetical protein